MGLDLGDLIGIDGTVFCSRRGELSLRVDDWTLLAKSLRPPPEKHHGAAGRRDALPPPRAGPDRVRGDARAVPRARRDHRRRAPLSRRGRLRRGRDAGPAAALRRRRRAALHDPSQRARPRRCTCGSRPSCTSSAASSAAWSASTSSARTSATRASRRSTTPSSRWSSCTRPTRTTETSPRARAAASPPPPSAWATTGRSTSSRRGDARRSPARSRPHGNRHPRRPRARRAGRRDGGEGPARPAERHVGAACRRAGHQARRADADRADLPVRLSPSSCRRSRRATVTTRASPAGKPTGVAGRPRRGGAIAPAVGTIRRDRRLRSRSHGRSELPDMPTSRWCSAAMARFLRRSADGLLPGSGAGHQSGPARLSRRLERRLARKMFAANRREEIPRHVASHVRMHGRRRRQSAQRFSGSTMR